MAQIRSSTASLLMSILLVLISGCEVNHTNTKPVNAVTIYDLDNPADGVQIEKRPDGSVSKVMFICSGQPHGINMTFSKTGVTNYFGYYYEGTRVWCLKYDYQGNMLDYISGDTVFSYCSANIFPEHVEKRQDFVRTNFSSYQNLNWETLNSQKCNE